MKRTFLFLLTAILLGAGLWSCNKDDDNGNNNGNNNGGGGNGGGTATVQWVDLGLPSGLLWADRNVGAQNPEDYGNYYAWGETKPKEVYDWDTYAYGGYNDSIGAYSFIKYCNMPNYGLNGFTDDLTTLEASDDAATVNLGGKARTPTEDEWQELINNTTPTWTTRNGVNGRLLTAPNGKSIFLPAAGGRDGSSLYDAGERGYYWSSTLYTGNPSSAWYFRFVSYTQLMRAGGRPGGQSVRAVRAK
jgi:hypothetical protein